MKALITGGLGFIGYHLSARLLAEGFEVHACDNGQRGIVDAHIEALHATGRYRLAFNNLVDEAGTAALDHDYTHVFHLAAIVGVKNVVEQPYRVLRDNVLMLNRILEWSRTLRSLRRFVFPSTSEVYAGTLQNFGMQIPTPESTPLTVADLERPRTSYMLSKIFGEALCRHANLPFTIIRPHNVYGPRMGMAHVIPELLERAHRTPAGGRLVVFSPNHKRTFCYINDAVELIIRLALSPAATNRVFNVGSVDEEISIINLAELIVQLVGKRLDIEAGADTEGSPDRRRADVSLALSVGGPRRFVELPEGLHRTYEWYRTHAFEAIRSEGNAAGRVGGSVA